MQNAPVHKKKNFVPGALKVLVAAGSLAGTIGIWSSLANKDITSASADNSNTSTTLQPIPTLVPLVIVDQVAAGMQTAPTDTGATVLRTVSAPTSSTIQNNNSKLFPPPPVTKTRSSKK